MKRHLLAVLLAALPLLPALAASDRGVLPLQEGMPFAEQRDHIHAQLADNKTYVEISGENRRQVVDALARIDAKLGEGGISRLSEADRLKVFNDQELVNSLLVTERVAGTVPQPGAG